MEEKLGICDCCDKVKTHIQYSPRTKQWLCDSCYENLADSLLKF